MRPYPEAAYLALKSKFRRLLDLCGGIDGAASSTRIARSQLHNCGSATTAQFPTIDVVLDLERAAGEPIITAELAAAHNMALVPRKAGTAEPAQATDILSLNARVASEMGDVLRVTLERAADNDLSINDLEAILQQQDEMLIAGERARKKVQEELARRRAA
jgi:hypothetical protein